MGKVVLNKHYDNASSVNLNSFMTDEAKRKGEVVVVNDANNPGLYIVDTNGRVINVTTQVDTDSIIDIINQLIVDRMKQDVLTVEQYQYKIDNNLIDPECMYYVYEGDGGGSGDTGSTGFIPFIVEGTEILETEEGSVHRETVEINGTYIPETEVFELPTYVPPTPQPTGSTDTEIVVDGEDYSMVTDESVEGEVLILNVPVSNEIATI